MTRPNNVATCGDCGEKFSSTTAFSVHRRKFEHGLGCLHPSLHVTTIRKESMFENRNGVWHLAHKPSPASERG